MLPGGALSPPVCLAGRSRLAGRHNLAGRLVGWGACVCVCVYTHQHRTGLGAFCGDNKLAGLRPAVSKGDVSLLGCLRPSKPPAREAKSLLFFPSSSFPERSYISDGANLGEQRLLANTETHMTC